MDSKIERRKKPYHKEIPYHRPLMTSHLSLVNELEKDANHSHTVYKVKKAIPDLLADVPEVLIPQRYKNTWFLKTDDCPSSITEVFAQEFFRLFIPNQQKTRLVKTDGKPNLNVLSKEILGFKSFREIDSNTLKQNLLNGSYYGLGDVLVLSLLLNESDLHDANIGINDEGQVVKIDGGLCFSQNWYADRNYDITEKDLRTLPQITDYEAHNWLGDTLTYYAPDCANHAEIRHEINAAILRVSTLPPRVIQKCAFDCIPSSLGIMEDDEQTDVQSVTEQLYADLLMRRLQLKRVALTNKSFQRYLLSDDAKTDLEYYADYLNHYKTVSKRGLPMETYEKVLYNNLNAMRLEISELPVYSNQLFKPQKQENKDTHDFKLQLRPRK